MVYMFPRCIGYGINVEPSGLEGYEVSLCVNYSASS